MISKNNIQKIYDKELILLLLVKEEEKDFVIELQILAILKIKLVYV